MKIFLSKIIASVFFIGYIKKGGGTAAALVTVLLFFYLRDFRIIYILTVLSIIIGTYISEISEMIWGHDSSRIVIDEFAGMAISLFLIPYSVWMYAIAFVLFRFFDIYKPFPVNRMQDIHGGAGVMMDDIISGIMANICLWIIICIKNLFV